MAPPSAKRAALEPVGTAQHLDPAQPQRFQQLVRRAAGAGQRQAIQRHRNARRMRARAPVDARATDGHLGAFVARRLRADAGLVGQHIGAGGQAAVGLGQVHHVAGAGHALERRAGLLGLAGGSDVDRVQGGGLRGGAAWAMSVAARRTAGRQRAGTGQGRRSDSESSHSCAVSVRTRPASPRHPVNFMWGAQVNRMLCVRHPWGVWRQALADDGMSVVPAAGRLARMLALWPPCLRHGLVAGQRPSIWAAASAFDLAVSAVWPCFPSPSRGIRFCQAVPQALAESVGTRRVEGEQRQRGGVAQILGHSVAHAG